MLPAPFCFLLKEADAMKSTLYGKVTNPVVVMAGSWDPFLTLHQELIVRMVNHSNEHNLSSMIVIFDPAPSKYILEMSKPDTKWITYNDVDVLKHYLFALGVNAVLRVHFVPEYLELGAAEFLDTIKEQAKIAEMWFGAKQRFGPGESGSQRMLIKLAKAQGISLRRLANAETPQVSYKVRAFLEDGNPHKAFAYTQTVPIRAKPSSGSLNLPWRPGVYRAIPLDRLNDANLYDLFEMGTHCSIDLTLTDHKHGAELHWPSNDIQYLAFVGGPRDR